MVESETLYLATLWRIERTDGVVYRFTDHNVELYYGFPESETFRPTNGVTSTARQKISGLRENNFELSGIISDTKILHEDLRAGRFREARITEILVDWRAPWYGPILLSKYWIQSVSFNGETWSASVAGVSSRLNRPIGELYTRNCRYTLGDTRCTIDLDLYKFEGTVTDVHESQRSFSDSGLPTFRLLPLPVLIVFPDNYYQYGNVLFTSGENKDLAFEISFSRDSGREFDLVLPTPFPIQVGDDFEVTPGCNKLLLDCSVKYLNLLNYGGFPTIPGSDKTLSSPAPKGESPLSKLGLDYFKI